MYKFQLTNSIKTIKNLNLKKSPKTTKKKRFLVISILVPKKFPTKIIGKFLSVSSLFPLLSRRFKLIKFELPNFTNTKTLIQNSLIN